MTTLSASAPAKLNLFLHITGRRDDGYHELQTLFQLLDFGDTLHFEVTGDTEAALAIWRAALDEDPEHQILLSTLERLGVTALKETR